MLAVGRNHSIALFIVDLTYGTGCYLDGIIGTKICECTTIIAEVVVARCLENDLHRNQILVKKSR